MFSKKTYGVNYRKKNVLVFIYIIFILLLIVYGFIIVDKKIKPTVLAIAEVKANEIASRAINESIYSKITDDIRYQDLYFIRTDNEGNVTLMQANTIMMNKLASEVARTVQDTIRNIKSPSIRVPLGNIFGSQLLAQYGPKINIDVTPIGKVNVDFTSEFEESGINQTRHKIYLIVKAQVKTIIPFSSSTILVETKVPITETIIVGKVPENYINVPKDEYMNVVPGGN
ncbi:sporulation protein YunB [Caminicella sporogenes DSM 14501]|uniref:Sporulation protein YunB n=1 Tax=Caminicella sporogenes DSM 14501 TaxID=1121266 RepID=A0A1M6T733_9FIRM|nr:sporulation protein YunB [Caminicella sporogenes]RKD26085.1 sporulation protein YunB [Caminicella sporogenes]SHK52750.1 sporulation protein YunB [Caminicella sporogenes DSM 14501]